MSTRYIGKLDGGHIKMHGTIAHQEFGARSRTEATRFDEVSQLLRIIAAQFSEKRPKLRHPLYIEINAVEG